MTGPADRPGARVWHVVDARGLDVVTGRAPAGRGRPTPAAALAAVPVPAWPLTVLGDDGRRRGLAGALGPGGDRVHDLLDALVAGPAPWEGEDGGHLEGLARRSPGGAVDLPLSVVDLQAGVDAAAHVDPRWLASVDRRRAGCRRSLEAAGRRAAVEAAVHLAMLLATEGLDPAGDADVDAHVASGARLWLLTGAVVSALSGAVPDPFDAWARLVVAGWWPVGPCEGRLVVSAPDRDRPAAGAVEARRAG